MSYICSAGTILDHVHLRESTNCQPIQCSVFAVYYSDHDVVQVVINST